MKMMDKDFFKSTSQSIQTIFDKYNVANSYIDFSDPKVAIYLEFHSANKEPVAQISQALTELCNKEGVIALFNIINLELLGQKQSAPDIAISFEQFKADSGSTVRNNAQR